MSSLPLSLTFIVDDKGRYFSVQPGTQPHHMVAAVDTTRMRNIVQLMTTVRKNRGVRFNHVCDHIKHSDVRHTFDLRTASIPSDDINFDKIHMSVLDLEDNASSQYIVRTLLFSGMKLLIVQDHTYDSHNGVLSLQGVVLTGNDVRDPNDHTTNGFGYLEDMFERS
jgi:hypothetical protein